MEQKQEQFTQLYLKYKNTFERYVYYKVSNHSDAEDIIQEALTAAYSSFDKLSDIKLFKQWLIGIASYKCIDYYNRKARKLEISLEASNHVYSLHGSKDFSLVEDVLNKLTDKNKQILYLYYIKGFNQKDIATRVNIPLGTVKSRIYTAKREFKEHYPCTEKERMKGSDIMKNKPFPDYLPKILITKSNKSPFSVKFEEVPGWLIIPRIGEKIKFGFYDDPDKRLTSFNEMECVRYAEIHGIPCVQINVREHDGNITNDRTLFVRLTETHCMYIAEMSIRNGTMYFGSFMDDEWCERYEIGVNNCGREIYQESKGIVTINDDGDLIVSKENIPDIVGRYIVEINNRKYDTVAIVSLDSGILVFQYVNQEGKTVLFRRFNKDDWKHELYKQKWTDKLPCSDTVQVDNDTYVHWYDCISDYVF